jgi:hypothetical protein
MPHRHLSNATFQFLVAQSREENNRKRTMKSVIAMATAVALTAVLPNVTFAQDNQSQSQTQHNQSVRAQVKQTLESAGFL